ncbi:hypothetical protein LMG26788_03731 [Achromobacter pulmonis]|uniref:Morphogenetic protein n=1 Tax=Achromobacter pulmonis TaxID=1389932 RepID=A0A6S7DDW7_9BURK|nr:hypothetical protein [Achromobacter pulmonis]CAB3888814.1 hypothetical protein LMG26788_03665 [Achromobacter pulmonis]CAB3890110.1 hypothetical protein LMG26788_03731 [Achromobacter pulmonis]
MRERPILFTGPMVRAILAGNKTQTRRVVKPWEPRPGSAAVPADISYLPDFTCYRTTCPYGQPGDRLWVRESTHRRPMLNLLTGEPLAEKYDGGAYTADGADVLTPEGFDLAWWYSRKSCPSIHMPRFACRLVLEVTGVRVERLQVITEEQARAEGITDGGCTNCGHNEPCGCDAPAPSAIDSFAYLWGSINGPGSWDANPWVWFVEFRRIEEGGANG